MGFRQLLEKIIPTRSVSEGPISVVSLANASGDDWCDILAQLSQEDFDSGPPPAHMVASRRESNKPVQKCSLSIPRPVVRCAARPPRFSRNFW